MEKRANISEYGFFSLIFGQVRERGDVERERLTSWHLNGGQAL
jgi:hypothetical protein